MAYAAVISLKHTIHHLKNPINPQITKSLHDELKVLEAVLKRLDDPSSKSSNRRVINKLDAEIREAVYKLEDELESYVLHLSSDSLSSLQIPSIEDKGGEMEEKIGSFFKTVEKLGEEYNKALQNPEPEEEDDTVLQTQDSDEKKSTTVGLWDQFEKIGNELWDLLSELKIVSLVGMAGIGKTLLARKLYQRSINVRYFNITAWVSVGPKRQIKDVLTDILTQIGHNPLYMEGDEYELAQRLYQSLHGRRYIIVLDDVWNTGVWDYLMRFFPDNKIGSRLLLTTRLEQIAFPTTSRVHKMPFLSNEESWDLLWRTVFVEEGYFPSQLEKAGRKIAENCEGLPLLILAVADILREHERTVEYWKKVADKKTTTFLEAYEKISKVLSSSYEYLPQHLKACFLYMGVFPQSYEIPLPKLINLWGIEDFLEPNQSLTLQDFAVECLEKLISQSLVIICKYNSDNKIKSLKLHSAYWHLSVKEARKNKFLLVLNKLSDGSQHYIESQRRLSVQNCILFAIKQMHDSMAATKLTARSLLCTGEDHQYPVPVCLDLILLKVLDALSIRFYEFPKEVLKLLQLRYLALTHNGKLSCFISKLQSLQILIVRQYHNIKYLRDSTCLPEAEIYDMQRRIRLMRNSSCLPEEIWDMQQLRHLQIMGSNLPDPSNDALLPNLSTLYVNAHSCTEDVFRSIPCLKKLGIKIELQPDAAETISCFEHIKLLGELESLKCVVVNPRLISQVVAPPHHLSNFPRSLKQLSLNGLRYSWKYMSAIGSLPNLKVLKLQCYAFEGAEWITMVGEFQSLEFLLLEDVDLVDWKTDDEKCFPILQRLIIRYCYKLKEMPWQIEEIATLKTFEIVDCSPLVEASAQKIHEGQSYLGNDSLQLLITSTWNI